MTTPESPRITLVGEDNPFGSNPQFALYPAPEGCAGERLCCDILGMWRKDYLRVFNRVNLCSGKWSIKQARVRAAELRSVGGKFILFGAKVCSAWPTPFNRFEMSSEGTVLILPHPSGRNLLWNEAGMIERAREVVAFFEPELASLLGVSPK